MALSIPFQNSYSRLPERLFARQTPAPVTAPRLLQLNLPLAEALGLDAEALASDEGVQALAGNLVPVGAEPIAQAYAGHQFGHFNPALGDGRAILLGEVVARDGRPRDLQLKGSGPTPWSRRGDGRAAVGPVLREYLISEAMHALGIPTTRSLAVVATGESVYREVRLPGAVLTRIAGSHLRVGTFQYFAARGDTEALRTLVDYALARHYPDAGGARGLLAGVVARQAELIARWMLVGFIHGVMNTDNCAISGETIDYGPCAFMDTFDPNTVFSSIDHAGRYRYGQQPRIGQWNLTRLAEALLPLLAEDESQAVAVAEEVLAGYAERFNTVWLGGLGRKLGLAEPQEGDQALVQDLLTVMAEGKADFTLTFRAMAEAAHGNAAKLRDQFLPTAALDDWLARWRARLAAEPVPEPERRALITAANSAVIPRNHLVEEALDAVIQRGDMAPFDALLDAVRRPFEEPADPRYTRPAPDGLPGYQTFCGT
jgi:serine/tyrosine/threonine adenylyltransferase